MIAIGVGGGTIGLDVGGIDNTQTIEFQNGNAAALLQIGSISGFHAVIDSFNSDAEIVLESFTGIGTTAATGSIIPIASIVAVTNAGGSHTLELFNNSGTEIGALTLSSNLTPTELSELETVNADGGLGAVPCFAEGTLIRTTRGDVPVEELREGDLIPTEFGGAAAPVVWIGRRTVDCARHPEPRKVWPVRVRAGAFGPGRPARDLWLSPDHAVFFEGVLIPVKYLINGAAIAQVQVDRVTYYHVELPRHDVILAEGLPTESFLDTGGKCMFENGGAPMGLHPDFAILRWEAEGCAPLVVTGPEVVAARRRLARAA
ncbi:MAG: Hint domain-containing protein [Acetobacteraceae bacterium]|nr:Hint domain-containing protein [Acetobacteraceae bacterium]